MKVFVVVMSAPASNTRGGSRHDVRPRQVEQVGVARDVARMVGEALAAVVLLREPGVLEQLPTRRRARRCARSRRLRSLLRVSLTVPPVPEEVGSRRLAGSLGVFYPGRQAAFKAFQVLMYGLGRSTRERRSRVAGRLPSVVPLKLSVGRRSSGTPASWSVASIAFGHRGRAGDEVRVGVQVAEVLAQHAASIRRALALPARSSVIVRTSRRPSIRCSSSSSSSRNAADSRSRFE